MSPSILSFPAIFFTSSVLFLISTSISPVQCTHPNITVSPSPPRLIQRACSNASTAINTDLCIRILQTIPKVVSARDLHNLTIAIVESGISNSTKTRRYIEYILYDQTTDARSEVKGALGQCKLSYDQIINRFCNALQEIKSYNYEYKATSYQLQSASTDCVKTCAIALAEQNLDDEVILTGNNAVPIFGISAISIIRDLHTPPTG